MLINRLIPTALLLILTSTVLVAQEAPTQPKSQKAIDAKNFAALKFRNIGPFRGGRSNAVVGHPSDSQTYFMGGTGGGIWKTSDAGITWSNISDGSLKTSGSVGAISISNSDPNVMYVGMGEHAVRGVMTSHGDGVYKSTDGGKSWTNVGLADTRHIAAVRIHPQDPNTVYVAAQGAVYGPSPNRGIYKTTDGGETWSKVLFVNETTGAADLSMDVNNPRVLYAGMWDHQRLPWKIRSGGPGSGIHKSTDGGKTWEKLGGGLPAKMGKVAVDVSPANSDVVYANIEANKGGVFRSNDGGTSWKQTSSNRVTVARAWYYIEIFADPADENRVYVLNAPMLRSIDGGKTFENIPNPHGDQHDLWINPNNTNNMILGNDGGACVSFNRGKSWSSQNNQPTAQFYRVITDNQFPYRLYAGQQDNSTISIASRTSAESIGERDWFPTAGGESAFLAFDPNDPAVVFGTSIQGMIDRHTLKTDDRKSIEVYPEMKLGALPKNQKHRWNWNGPLAGQYQDPSVMYLGANIVFRTADAGHSWTEISGDLTRNETEKHLIGGGPYTDENAGGEVYNTIAYIATCPHNAGTIWVGTDDGLVQRTDDEGKTWTNVTPVGLEESLINSIELSSHDPSTAFITATRYKFEDLTPLAYKTTDNGKSWTMINRGIPDNVFIRVVRQDPLNPQILYAGTESGLYISFDQGNQFYPFQLNLPVCAITDLAIKDNDLIVATSGRAFWILDDLGAIQQSNGKLEGHIFGFVKPKEAVKFSAASGSEPSQTSGQNPMPGVTFDFQLPSDWVTKTVLKLEITDANGTVLRTMTSEKPKNFKSWVGGPAPPTVLPAKPGLNRFFWDLRMDPIAGVNQVFVMPGHAGPRVVPGSYQLKLSYSEKPVETKPAEDESNDAPAEAESKLAKEQIKTAEMECVIKPDPRVTGNESDYQLQNEMLMTIRNTANDVHESVSRFRQVKSQLAVRLKAIGELKEMEELIEIGRKTMSEINAWESKLVQNKQKTFQDVINYPNKFNIEMLMLGSQIDTNEPRPTVAAQERLTELTEQWESHKQELEGIISGSIAEFNSTYQKAKLPALIIPTDKQ
ncbi:MAG: photosystem II stability/assembly factor-like uncharacterized protein [Mariniblastus sp.]|jgi:photosystem II stability/assembly factor-like uncharacterized protein